MESINELESLSYRDLQTRAKSLGIAANKKKEVLIESITSALKEARSAEPSPTPIDISSETVTSEDDVGLAAGVNTDIEASVDVIPECEEALDVIATYSNVQDEIAVILKMNDEDIAGGVVRIIDDAGVEDTTKASEEESDSNQIMSFSTPTKPLYQEDECDGSDYCEHLDGDLDGSIEENCEGPAGKLKGLPTPKGIRTMIASPDPTILPGVHWRYEDYDEQGQQDTAQILEAVDLKLRGLPTPKGARKVFASPEAIVGKDVHWHIDDYDQPNKENVAQVGLRAPTTTPVRTALGASSAAARLMTPVDKMSFWLSKGGKSVGTPSK